MYYYRARHYAPALGRFIQPDPLGPTDGPNLYAYVQNRPAILVDPMGTQEEHVDAVVDLTNNCSSRDRARGDDEEPYNPFQVVDDFRARREADLEWGGNAAGALRDTVLNVATLGTYGVTAQAIEVGQQYGWQAGVAYWVGGMTGSIQAYEAVTGYDLMTGQALSTSQRVLRGLDAAGRLYMTGAAINKAVSTVRNWTSSSRSSGAGGIMGTYADDGAYAAGSSADDGFYASSSSWDDGFYSSTSTNSWDDGFYASTSTSSWDDGFYASTSTNSWDDGLYASGSSLDDGFYAAGSSVAQNFGPGAAPVNDPAFTHNAVIGKLDDLQTVGANEYTLLDCLPDQGSPKLNWKQNSSVLRQEMSRGVPIRDASAHLPDTHPSVHGHFLGAERNLLSNHGWTRDAGGYWNPPPTGGN